MKAERYLRAKRRMYKVKGLQILFKPATQKQKHSAGTFYGHRPPNVREKSTDLPPYFTGYSRLANDFSFSSLKPHFYWAWWNPATVLILVTFCVFNHLFRKGNSRTFPEMVLGSEKWRPSAKDQQKLFWLETTEEQWKSCLVRLWVRDWDKDRVRRINFHDCSSEEEDKKWRRWFQKHWGSVPRNTNSKTVGSKPSVSRGTKTR